MSAATEAVREAGRALGTAPDAAIGQAPAQVAARSAVEDQSVQATGVVLAHAPRGSGCQAAGSDANTATGQFVVERDRYVDG